jgi:class 3 adenylate cyclase
MRLGAFSVGDAATTPTDPTAPSAERRQVTALFLDMVGFTAISEPLGEEGTFALIQPIYELMARAVREQGGSVKDFTGDSIMALFGVPNALEDAPLRACRAGLAIHERLAAAAPPSRCQTWRAAQDAYRDQHWDRSGDSDQRRERQHDSARRHCEPCLASANPGRPEDRFSAPDRSLESRRAVANGIEPIDLPRLGLALIA